MYVISATDFLGESPLEQLRGRDHRSGMEGRVPVDHRALGMVQHLRCHRPPAIAQREPGKALNDMHRGRMDHGFVRNSR